MARCGMHHQTCRLVHHQQMSVFVHHVQRHLLWAKRLALFGGPNFHRQHLTGLDLVRVFEHHLAIQAHTAQGLQLLQITAREFRHQIRQGFI